MNYSNYRFKLDIQSTQSQVSLPVSQFDTGRSLYITLTESGSAYIIEDGCIAVLFAQKSDGTTLTHYCIIENRSRIRYDFTDQTASCPGKMECEIRLYDPDGKVLTSPRFIVVVDTRVVEDEEVVLSESDNAVLDEIIASEKERIYAENERVEAEKARQETYEDLVVEVDKATEAAHIIEEKLATGGYDGEDGETPYIGENGHWWIGTEDTGVMAGAGAVGHSQLSDLSYEASGHTGFQQKLVSGTNIKTINNTSILGSGNISAQPTLVSGSNIKTVNNTSILGSGNIAVQPTLVSGTNIKTINGNSILGSGNITISGGGSGGSSSGNSAVFFTFDDSYGMDGYLYIYSSSPQYSDNGNYEIHCYMGSGSDSTSACRWLFRNGEQHPTGAGFNDGCPYYPTIMYHSVDCTAFRIQNTSMSYGSQSGSYNMLVPYQHIDSQDLTCFIEGTQVAMADGTTKPIEEVQVGEELAYWSGHNNAVSTAKVLIPPFNGTCTEYNKFTWSDGTELNIYGRQRMFNVEQNGMVNIHDFKTGEHTLNLDGEQVALVGSELIRSDTELKHYWIVSSTGAYTVNGLLTGSVKALTYMYLMRDKDNIAEGTNLEYYKSLYDCHQAKKHIFESREYLAEIKEVKSKLNSNKKQMKAIQDELSSLDYKTIKYYEGAIDDKEFEKVKNHKKDLRSTYNDFESANISTEAEFERITAKYKAIAEAYKPADFRR